MLMVWPTDGAAPYLALAQLWRSAAAPAAGSPNPAVRKQAAAHLAEARAGGVHVWEAKTGERSRWGYVFVLAKQ